MPNNKLTTKRLAEIFKKVPEKKFRITDLAFELVNDKGRVDITKAMDQQGEINLAIAEVNSYVRSTKEVMAALARLGGDRTVVTFNGFEEDEDLGGESE